MFNNIQNNCHVLFCFLITAVKLFENHDDYNQNLKKCYQVFHTIKCAAVTEICVYILAMVNRIVSNSCVCYNLLFKQVHKKN